VKAHAGIEGNNVADTLAKDTAQHEDGIYVYNRIPISTIASKGKGGRAQKMASAMGKGSEWSNMQIFLSESGAEAQITDPNNT